MLCKLLEIVSSIYNTTDYVFIILAMSVTPLSDDNIFAKKKTKEPLHFAQSEIGVEIPT